MRIYMKIFIIKNAKCVSHKNFIRKVKNMF